MAVRIVRLGSPRAKDEGLRIGTVRRPPRGVPKSEFAARDWYDVWFPNLAPSAERVKQAQDAKTPKEWAEFARHYRAEMATPENARTLDLLAALSHQANFSVGCYCEDETHCHRTVLRELLEQRGAKL
ncbi:DUF488 domain-containing protein [Pseudoxanthomonas putridarboris]|uniref:DUF488 family protein n=1 Tax=Pseudoxanthomonas putridarboris TaxID=752605 RepID=A0ABU9J4J5_9GAMM